MSRAVARERHALTTEEDGEQGAVHGRAAPIGARHESGRSRSRQATEATEGGSREVAGRARTQVVARLGFVNTRRGGETSRRW